MRVFRDRRSAGQLLGEHLESTGRYTEDTVVLALPRGGVPVGAAVADVLGCALDIVVVRKLGAPSNREFAMGAIGSGGALVIDQGVIAAIGVDDRALRDIIARERDELERRESLYRGDRPPVDVDGRDVVIVDDGIATGSSMRAAIDVLGVRGPSSITVAVPVAPPESLARFRGVADHVEALEAPKHFLAVGSWYDDFTQTSDAEVRALLGTV
jgi:predicted phosphoribosyltransferase